MTVVTRRCVRNQSARRVGRIRDLASNPSRRPIHPAAAPNTGALLVVSPPKVARERRREPRVGVCLRRGCRRDRQRGGDDGEGDTSCLMMNPSLLLPACGVATNGSVRNGLSLPAHRRPGCALMRC